MDPEEEVVDPVEVAAEVVIEAAEVGQEVEEGERRGDPESDEPDDAADAIECVTKSTKGSFTLSLFYAGSYLANRTGS